MRSRLVYGAGDDEPLEGAGLADRFWLHADARGSNIAQSNAAGGLHRVNNEDEYGNHGSGVLFGRFGYTGQACLPDAGLY